MRSSVLAYFLLTFAAAWSIFIPVAMTSRSGITPIQAFLVTLGAYTPSLAALLLTRRSEGDPGVRALLGRVLAWKVGGRWYLFAALFLLTIKLAAALILRVSTGEWPRFGTESLALIPIAVLFSTPFQAGEEIGWRGYALPRLAERFGLGIGSLVLGVLWALWHLPLFFVRGADTHGQSFLVYALTVTAIAVPMAWTYARTGSLLPVMLMHAAANNTKDIVPSRLPGAHDTFGLTASPVSWVTLSLLWVAAIVFLARMPRSIASPPEAPGAASEAGPGHRKV